jgi:hypothetical protein
MAASEGPTRFNPARKVATGINVATKTIPAIIPNDDAGMAKGSPLNKAIIEKVMGDFSQDLVHYF